MVEAEIAAICARARVAARKLAPHPRADKDAALKALAKRIRAAKADILAANARECAQITKHLFAFICVHSRPKYKMAL